VADETPDDSVRETSITGIALTEICNKLFVAIL